ncbi:hypothetical protein PPN31114_03517 [Pandoraea pneumonica]|uniref:Phage gp6-like head-tail connector protein n=1 Tax=Pandoraea pneumonica TaxID=2508299 RepID=A0A5E4WX35_9BURK|nr:head-tail connector protein [Pandoraea pneumonica]VVE28280.1 hypothetical protein PPN31114_03517 [Pandoraea pneumonica]
MLVTYAEVWRHLRLRGSPPADGGSDPHVELLAKAAQRKIENDTGRKLYPAEEKLPEDAPESAMAVTEDVRVAMLMLIGHWYEHREAVGDGAQLYTVPLAYEALVGPYRWFSL